MVDQRWNEDEGMYLYSDSNDVVNDFRYRHSNHEANDVALHGCIFNIDKPMVELSREDIIGMIFESLSDAWKLYKAYSLSKGFGVRRGSTRHNSEGVLVGQQFCCSKEGFRIEKLQKCNRKRRSRPIQRSGCKASVRVNMDGRGKWTITYFEEEHNHDMCHQSHTCFIRSNREMKPSDLAEAKAMKGVGIRTSHIMNYLTQQAGGIQNVGFTSKDLYNHLNMVSKDEICNGDVVAVLAYFQIKQESDIGFYMKYSIDDENRLHNLFWADATSRSDYACFGDVVAFDTTYKKNAYNRPLMPIVGVNHHHQTIVFGLALLADETTDTFVWVLRTFFEAMLNKSPISFVTDGDRAMQRAIKTVFPTARHRLCTWHLPRNAKVNIPDALFVEGFNRCMNSWWTQEEFDREWNAMVRHFNVENHPWIIEKDRTRDMWAQAYITGHFFGTLRSTQRCESMNAYLAIYLESKKTFMEFVRAIDQGVSKLRTNELEADYVSRHTEPYRVSKLVDIECHAASVYTRDSFSVFQEELQLETLYHCRQRMIEEGTTQIYTLGKYKHPNKRIQVVFDAFTQSIQCSCHKFATINFPYKHQIHVMKLEDMSKIPASLIMHRWTKDAKVSAPSFVDVDVEPQYLQMVRYASLSSRCNKMCYVASKTTESFNQAKMEILRLTSQMEELCNLQDSLTDKMKTPVYDPVKKTW